MMRQRKTQKLALSGLLAAVGLVVLLLGCALPNGKLAVSAVASLCVAIDLMAAGYIGGLGCYVVTALLGLLLLPAKEVAVFYAVLFGPYAIIKLWCEQRKSRVAEWAVKIIASGALLAVCSGLMKELLGWGAEDFPALLRYVWIVGVVIYDLALSRLLGALSHMLMPVLRRGRFIE